MEWNLFCSIDFSPIKLLNERMKIKFFKIIFFIPFSSFPSSKQTLKNNSTLKFGLKHISSSLFMLLSFPNVINKSDYCGNNMQTLRHKLFWPLIARCDGVSRVSKLSALQVGTWNGPNKSWTYAT